MAMFARRRPTAPQAPKGESLGNPAAEGRPDVGSEGAALVQANRTTHRLKRSRPATTESTT
ncbi:hypothetical protein MFUR16E_16125 [Methylobacterium fujisawaense]